MVLESPHLRADAQRNLERILDAGQAVFAEMGLDASVADVAERAGVGTATIFRRFPTKDDLVAAVVAQELTRLLDRARAIASADDPAGAIGELMIFAVETFTANRCFCEASGGELFTRPQIQEIASELTGTLERLLRRAQKAGAIRRDVVAADLAFLITALGNAGLQLEATAPGAWRRYVELVLDGLRPEGASRLRHKPPTHQQLHDAKTSAVHGAQH